MKFSFCTIFIFLGSVFFISGKFVTTGISAKHYFTEVAFLICVIILFLKNENLSFVLQKLNSKLTVIGLFIVGIFQAVFGLLQYFGRYPSNNNNFDITGSFENPAGFVAVLSLLFPIGIYFYIKSIRFEKHLIIFSTGLILFSIILSNSRTGILSAITSAIIVLIVEFQLILKIKNLRCTKLIKVTVIITALLVAVIFYKWREDSVNGRFLIWKISIEMIKEKPLVGFGQRGFQINYLDYQALYFKNHPNSVYRQLADNTKHPFNIFIKITVNYGIIGLLFYLMLLGYFLREIYYTKNIYRSLLFGVYFSFLILTSFSYPLLYPPIWFLLCFYVIILFSNKIPKVDTPIFLRITAICVSLVCLIFVSFNMHNEIRWKTVAVKSLLGKTKQMLPKYERLYKTSLNKNQYFLYNFGAELNVANKFEESSKILHECMNYFNDYDLQMLLAENYSKMGDLEKAIKILNHASNMIPCRFLPIYRLFEIYKEKGDCCKATFYAKEIINKEVKIPSTTVSSIIFEAEFFLKLKTK